MRSEHVRAHRFVKTLAIVAALSLFAALPAGTAANNGNKDGYRTSQPAFVALEAGISGSIVPLVNSGDEIYGDTFEGLPDGIGIAPENVHKSSNGQQKYIDLYVTHEQSHVPFGLTPTSVFADFQDSSVSRVRLNVKSKLVTDLSVAISPDLGFIRFCSATMVGPDEGFKDYTFLVNEESNDVIPVPAGAPYGSDPSTPAGQRQAGYNAFVDTKTGKVDVITTSGRMNHENLVVVPGWTRGTYALTGDDTFTSPSTPERPNLSQLYMYAAADSAKFLGDEGHLWAFRVTGTDGGPVDPTDAFNDANDFFEINVGDSWTGEFIPVPDDIARGDTNSLPQDALEDWSNANNVFQFIRVEDIAFDPDAPRTVYFADTGNSRLLEDAGTGRLYRAPSGTPGTSSSIGRVFKMVMNASDPTKVDAFSVLTDASTLGMRNPDNVAVSHNSLMVQEDTSSFSKVWRYDLASETWTHVATATQEAAETSGIVDVSRWFGPGWWALDVQSHQDDVLIDPTYRTWTGPTPPGGDQYRLHREAGQLMLIQIQGS